MAKQRRYPQKTSRTHKKAKSLSPFERLIITFFSLFTERKKTQKNRSTSLSLIKISRWGASLIALLAFLIWSGSHSLPPPIPSGNAPPLFFSNQCDDDLRAMYIQAINEAKKSILLCMYSLNDSRIIRTLKEKAESGVDVTVIHDPSTPQFGYHKLGDKVHRIEKKGSGLMHQKILVVDEEKIWLGSANFTTQSLRMDGNLVIGLGSTALAQTIAERSFPHPHDFVVGGQRIEYWSLPEDKVDALQRIVSLIDSAKKTVCVAMFTLTHNELTNAIIRAHLRNVTVEVVLDAGQAMGASEKSFKELKRAGIFVRLNTDSNLLHHKFTYIDNKILVNGSANWTKAAFSKNDDCFLVIHDLNEEQVKKMEKLWHTIRALSSNEKTISIEEVFIEKKAA